MILKAYQYKPFQTTRRKEATNKENSKRIVNELKDKWERPNVYVIKITMGKGEEQKPKDIMVTFLSKLGEIINTNLKY